MESSTSAISASLSDHQLAILESEKVFFGHKSVGNNLLQGIRELMAEDSRIKLKIVNSAHPQSVSGPAFVESEIGENGDPQSKNQAFAAVLGKGMGVQGGIAMYKYCYVDFGPSTDVQHMFEDYRNHITALNQGFPLLKLVHITVPLTTVEPAAKAWINTIRGKTSARELDRKRNQFNTLLRKTYAGNYAIFDLAEIESTRPDGSRSFFFQNNEKIYTLAPELTTDGGHLNELGRRAAAKELLLHLSNL